MSQSINQSVSSLSREIGAAVRRGVIAFHLVVIGMLLLGGSNVFRREIQLSELSSLFKCSSVPSSGGIGWVIKPTKKSILLTYLNSGCPSSSSIFIPRYAAISGSIAAGYFLVPKVLSVFTDTEIGSAIIESVSIDVIRALAFRGRQYLGMHLDDLMHSESHELTSDRVIAVISSVPSSTPRLLRQPFVVIDIDDCNLSLCERNIAI